MDDDNSGSPVGPVAVKAWRTWQILRVVGVVLFAAVAGAAGGIWILFVVRNGDPSVGAVATLAVVGVLAGIAGFVVLWSGVESRFRAIDAAVAVLRFSYTDVSAYLALGLLRSRESAVATLASMTPTPVTTVVLPGWTPDLVRPILPGPTEHDILRVHRVVWYLGIAVVLVLALLGTLRLARATPTWYATWGVAAGILAVSFVIWLVAIWAGSREFREGYSTDPAGAQLVPRGQRRPVDAKRSLDFVDGKTGYLLRHSDANLLTPPIYAARLRQIRAAHPDARPTFIAR